MLQEQKNRVLLEEFSQQRREWRKQELEDSRNTTRHEREQQDTSQESLNKSGKSTNHKGVSVLLLQFPLRGLPWVPCRGSPGVSLGMFNRSVLNVPRSIFSTFYFLQFLSPVSTFSTSYSLQLLSPLPTFSTSFLQFLLSPLPTFSRSKVERTKSDRRE